MIRSKANELLAKYMQAELGGQDEVADSSENELNKAGWFIVNGEDGLTVEKKGGGFFDGIASSFSSYPTESKIKPYSSTKDEKAPWNVWVIVGLSTAGLIGLTALIVYFIKRGKNG